MPSPQQASSPLQWVSWLGQNRRAKKDFLRWLDRRIQELALTAATKAGDMSQVLGMRYTIGELELLKSAVLFDEQEGTRIYGFVGQVQSDTSSD